MIRVVVYNSNSVMLAGLVSILKDMSNLEIVGSFADEASLVALSDLQPDLLLLERTSEEDLWWLEQWMSAADFEIAGILLTNSLSDRELKDYLSLGFKAFLPHSVDTDEVMAAIAAVMAGLIVLHPELDAFAETEPAIVPLPQPEIYLTDRELEVLQLLRNGLDNKAIASTLQISKHTVKFHISSILSKLHVSSRTEAVTSGLRQGLIRL